MLLERVRALLPTIRPCIVETVSYIVFAPDNSTLLYSGQAEHAKAGQQESINWEIKMLYDGGCILLSHLLTNIVG